MFFPTTVMSNSDIKNSILHGISERGKFYNIKDVSSIPQKMIVVAKDIVCDPIDNIDGVHMNDVMNFIFPLQKDENRPGVYYALTEYEVKYAVCECNENNNKPLYKHPRTGESLSNECIDEMKRWFFNIHPFVEKKDEHIEDPIEDPVEYMSDEIMDDDIEYTQQRQSSSREDDIMQRIEYLSAMTYDFETNKHQMSPSDIKATEEEIKKIEMEVQSLMR